MGILPRRASKPAINDAFDRRHPFAGLREAAGAPHLRGALLTVFATSLHCAPLITFIPVLVSAAFHGDASRFSVAVGSFGVGGLLGAIRLPAVLARHDRRRWSSYAAVGYGLVVVLAAILPWFWGLPVLMVLAGAAMAVSNVSAISLLQATASPRLLGETASLYMLAMRGGLSLGSLLTGLSVGLLRVRCALLINGALAMVAHLAIGRVWMRSPLPKNAAATQTMAM